VPNIYPIMRKIYLFLFCICLSTVVFPQVGDQTFNLSGNLTIDIDGNESQEKFFLQNDNKLLITGQTNAGSAITGTKQAYLTRYSSNAELDSNYGENGVVRLSYASQTFFLGSLLLNNQKSLILTMHGFNPRTYNLTRVNENGSLDQNFGVNGVLQILENLGSFSVSTVDLFEYNEKILLSVNYREVISGPTLTRVYSFNSDGTSDEAFGENGFIDLDFGFNSHFITNLIAFEGMIYMNGFISFYPDGSDELEQNSIIIRFSPTGITDTLFGSGGVILNDIVAYSDLDIQPDGKLVVVGSVNTNMQGLTSGDMAILRFNPNGSLDSTFNSDGFDIKSLDMAADFANEAVILENGKIVIGGSYFQAGFDGMLVQYNAAGVFSNSFGSFGNDSIYNIGNITAVTNLILTGDTLYTMGSAFNSGTGQNAIIRKVILNQGLNAPNSLTGTIDYNQNCGESNVLVSTYQPGSNLVLESYQVDLSEDGVFIIPDLEQGTVDLFIKVEGYLQKVIENVLIESGSNSVEIGPLSSGDLNGDNMVNLTDFSILCMTFGFAAGDDTFNQTGDFNCTGEVNISDFSILNLVFGQTGDAPPSD